jgi:hypothetical protein
MLTEIWKRFEAIEECYEFMLAYAAQGLPHDQDSASGRQVREFLNRAVKALAGLAESCAVAMWEENIEGSDRLPTFLAVLERDASYSLAAMELVLAQPAISSQLIDNLNASVHLRALLTDVFLLGEILKTQERAKSGNLPVTAAPRLELARIRHSEPCDEAGEHCTVRNTG